MAKISQTLSMPTGGGIPNTSPAQKLSISPEVQAIASVASAGLDLWGKAQVKQEQQRQQSQLGKAQVSLLDLQDEAMNQQEQARQVRGQISSFYENDGELSGDELKMMAGLKEQLSKFDLLSPSQRQIRKNALFRQALNDPANAGMQSSIISLFGGQKAEPVEDFSQQEAAQVAMDGKYGQGSWTQEDLARERGRAMYLSRMQQQASVNIDATIQQLDVITAAAQDDLTTAIGQAYQKHGFVPPEMANELRLKIADSQTQMRQTMIESLQASGKHLTPELRDKVETELAENVAVLNKFMSGEGNMLDQFGLSKQLEARNNLTKQLIEYNAPNVLKAANSSFVGGANNSYGGFDAMMKIFTDPSNTSLLDALGITEDERAVGIAAGTATLKYILSADERAKEQMGRYGFTRLDAALAGNIGIPMAQDKEQVDRALELATQAEDAKDFADILTATKNVVAIKSKGAEESVKTSVLRNFDVMKGKLGISQEAINSLVVEDGEIVFSEETRDLLGNNPRVKRANSQQVAEYLRNINSIIAKYPDTVKAEELLSIHQQELPEETESVSTGQAARRERAAANRSKVRAVEQDDVLQEAITDPAEIERIEAEAAKLAPVDPKDLIDMPSTAPATPESSGFIDALSRLEAGDMGYDSINAVPTGNYQGHTNARSYITPVLEERFGSASLTERTVGELIDVGSEWAKAKGSGKRASGAMGFGQITPTTMDWLVKQGVVSRNDKFDKATQDKMVEYLLYNKQKDVRDYLNGTHNDLDKAAKALGQEWEAFSKAGNKDTAKRILKALRGQ